MKKVEFRDTAYKAVLYSKALDRYFVSDPMRVSDGLCCLFDKDNTLQDEFEGNIYGSSKFINEIPNSLSDLDWEHIGNLQYVGRKDINGREIFEEDVVIRKHYPFYGDAPEVTTSTGKCEELNYVGVVKWDNESASYQIELEAVSDLVSGFASGKSLSEYEDLEVIGSSFNYFCKNKEPLPDIHITAIPSIEEIEIEKHLVCVNLTVQKTFYTARLAEAAVNKLQRNSNDFGFKDMALNFHNEVDSAKFAQEIYVDMIECGLDVMGSGRDLNKVPHEIKCELLNVEKVGPEKIFDRFFTDVSLASVLAEISTKSFKCQKYKNN